MRRKNRRSIEDKKKERIIMTTTANEQHTEVNFTIITIVDVDCWREMMTNQQLIEKKTTLKLKEHRFLKKWFGSNFHWNFLLLLEH